MCEPCNRTYGKTKTRDNGQRKYLETLQLLPEILEIDSKAQETGISNVKLPVPEQPQIELGHYNTGLFEPYGFIWPSSKDIQSISSKMTDWRIPRPLLYTSSNRTDSSTYTSNYERNIRTVYGLKSAKPERLDNASIHNVNEAKWFSSGSSSSSSLRTASSGSLLISPSNSNSLKHETITVKPADTQSIASSTHFTLINGVTVSKKRLSSCCNKSKQITVLVITMTGILFCGILGAILFVEMRAMELRHS